MSHRRNSPSSARSRTADALVHLGIPVSLLLIAAIAILPAALGASVSCNNHYVTFVPNMEFSYSCGIGGSEHLDGYVRAETESMSDYISLVDPAPGTGPRTVRAEFAFPESLPPGRYNFYLGGRESVPPNAPIGGVAAMQVLIQIKVLDPGKWIDLGFYVPDANAGETITIKTEISNNGQIDLASVSGTILVYDESEALKATISSDTIPIPSDTKGFITATLPTAGWDPGNFRAVLTVTYDGETKGPFETTFRLGTPDISLLEYTKIFAKDAINKVQVNVLSNWSGILTDVYATIQVNGKTLQTPSTTVGKFSSQWLETYWETGGLEYGAYPAQIAVTYRYKNAKGQIEEKTKRFDATFSITPSMEPKDERPEEMKREFSLKLNSTTLIYLAVILVTVFNIVYFMRKKGGTAAAPAGPGTQEPPSPPRHNEPPREPPRSS